jgi:hypothetical protein
MKHYKVIWLDDEFRTLNSIDEDAHLNEVHLFGFDNATEGIEELERNLMHYDAAILDGKFFRKPGQTGDSVDDQALGDVAKKLEQLSVRKKLPWFILSGQISFTQQKNPYAVVYKDNHVFDKTKKEDWQALWKTLKAEADQQEDTQIRHDYYRVFEVCTDQYIGNVAANDLLAVLRKENTKSAFTDPNLYFNPLRKIMEDFFRACSKWGLLLEVFVKNGVVLNESSKFLSGMSEKGHQPLSPIFPKVVSDHVKQILSVCQPASHRLEIDKFVLELNTPYLLLSTTYQLLDVLL